MCFCLCSDVQTRTSTVYILLCCCTVVWVGFMTRAFMYMCEFYTFASHFYWRIRSIEFYCHFVFFYFSLLVVLCLPLFTISSWGRDVEKNASIVQRLCSQVWDERMHSHTFSHTHRETKVSAFIHGISVISKTAAAAASSSNYFLFLRAFGSAVPNLIRKNRNIMSWFTFDSNHTKLI